MKNFFRIPILRKTNFVKRLNTCINYSSGHESKPKCKMTCTVPEREVEKTQISDINSFTASK